MKKSSKFSKLFYIPAWRTGAVERELAEHVQNGYKPVDFQEILFSIWRITFQKSERCPHDYYLFGRFQAGRGSTLGYDSPCGKEERKISDISRRTLVIGADLLVAELNPDADPHTVAKYRVEKMKAARKLYVSFLLFELLMLPFICLVAFIFVPHDIFFNSFNSIILLVIFYLFCYFFTRYHIIIFLCFTIYCNFFQIFIWNTKST